MQSKRSRIEPNRFAKEQVPEKKFFTFYIRKSNTYRSFEYTSQYMSLIPIKTQKLCQYQEYPLTFSGEVMKGMFLGAGSLLECEKFENRVERIMKEFTGQGNMSDYVKNQLLAEDSDDDSRKETRRSDNDSDIDNHSESELDKTRGIEDRDLGNTLADIAHQENALFGTSRVAQKEISANNPTLVDIRNLLNEQEERRSKQTKYIMSKIRSIESMLLKTKTVKKDGFEDEEIQGHTSVFKLSEIYTPNITKFGRNYILKLHGQDYVINHTFSGNKNNRDIANSLVIEDLQKRIKQCYTFKDEVEFLSIFSDVTTSLNTLGRELKRKSR